MNKINFARVEKAVDSYAGIEPAFARSAVKCLTIRRVCKLSRLGREVILLNCGVL